MVRQADVQLEQPAPEEPDPPQVCGFDAAELNMVKEAEQWGRCFNCGEEGH